MARSPRASVSKTSGQGTSRLSYQKGYALGNRGGGADFGGALPDIDGPREYSKGKGGGDMNISYGETLPIGDLADVKNLAKTKVGKSSLNLVPGKQKKMK